MKVFITGGKGYIGSHLVYKLIETGHEVIVFDNSSTGKKEFDHVQYIAGDVRELPQLVSALKDTRPDVVVHLAALIDVVESEHYPQFYLDTNVIGTHHVLLAMKEAKVDRIINISSAAVYDNVGSYAPQPENMYGQSKLMAEELVAYYGRHYDYEYTTFRLFNVAGAQGKLVGDMKKDTKALIPSLLLASLGVRKFELFTDLDTKREFIHVKDVAELIERTLETSAYYNNSYDISYGQYSVAEVMNVCHNATNVKIEYTYSPKLSAKSSKNHSDKGAIEYMFHWQPRFDLVDMVCDAYDWYRTNIKLFKEL